MDGLVNVSRRRFLKASGVAGGGLVVGFTLTGCSSSAPPVVRLEGDFVPNAFLQITPENHFRFYCPRDEMGQGVNTGLTTLVAEELDVAPWEIEVLWAGVHSDYANPEFGVQGTGGSTSIKAHYRQLRQVGANVRAVLLEAAAGQLGRPIAELSTDGGHVLVDGERLPYGQFVATAAALEAPAEAPTKPASEFKYIGKEFARIDALEKSTGAAEFGIDIDVPGLHHGVVRRCPVTGGTLKSYRDDKARSVPGVTDVVEVGSGVAVVADRYWAAKKGAQALEVEWSLPPLASLDTERLRADYRAGLDRDGDATGERGDLDAGFGQASQVVETEYWAPYLAHAPMEPMNAVVRIEGGEADVWTGSQSTFAVQGLVARFSGLEKSKVRAHNTYLGGGFGRRATLTHVIEATQLAVATNKPIKVLWSREDDIQSGVYRPASLMRIKAGVDDAGRLTAWQAKRIGGNITPDTLRSVMPALLPEAVGDGVIDWMVGLADGAFDGWVVDHSSIEGLYEDYDTPNREVRHVTVNHGLPLTFWRSVGHSYTAFAKETMMDELAAKAGLDAVEFRLRNTQDKPRLHNVIRVAGERLRQWPRRPGRHLGFAAHNSFSTDVAEVAEVSVDNGAIKVHRVLCVVDCGVAVNPDIVRAQMEGSVMYGLTAALHGELDLENGSIKQSNFHDYPILRMNEAPAVDVVIIDSSEEPTGVGEPGLPPIAPAVANAVFAATGQRLRSLPLKLA